MLSEIDFVTKYLQNSDRSLSEFRDAVDSSLDACEEEKYNPESKLFGCRQGKNKFRQIRRLFYALTLRTV